MCHGLAFWFDVAFAGSQQTVWLSTGPTEPLTHWYQVRCLLEEPISVKQGQLLRGRVLLVANKRQSYDVTIDLTVEGTGSSSTNTLDLKNPYFRYTGAPVQPPPGVSNISPSENYWHHLDAQGARNGKTMVISAYKKTIEFLSAKRFAELILTRMFYSTLLLVIVFSG